jgi:hypothetical protein
MTGLAVRIIEYDFKWDSLPIYIHAAFIIIPALVIALAIFMLHLYYKKRKLNRKWALHYARTNQDYKSLNYPVATLTYRTKKGTKKMILPRYPEDIAYSDFPGGHFWRYMRKKP